MLRNIKQRYATVTGSESAARDGGGGGGGSGQDLVSILDRSQRADLIVLITLIIESMRGVIVDNFRLGVSELQERVDEVCQHQYRHQEKEDEEDEDGNLRQTEHSDDVLVPQHSEESVPDSAIKGDGSSTTTASSTSAVNTPHPTAALLRAEADTLTHFADWTESVLLRIGNVVNSDADEHKMQQKPSQTDVGSEETLTTTSLKKDEETPAALHHIYPPVETPLLQLPRAKRLLILHSLLLLLLSLEHYNAYSRVFMLRLTSSLGLSLKDLNGDESRVARGLLDAAVALSGREQQQTKKSDPSRKWKVGVASVAGAALIGITGGLAAPLVAAGLGTVLGGLGLGATAAAGYLGALAGSSVIVGGLFGAYGGRMTGRMMDKYAREVEDFAFVPIRGRRQRIENEREAAQQDHRLRVTIGITGWVTEEDNFVIPWRVIGADTEVFGLRWELEVLMNLGNSISALVTSAAWSVAGREVLSHTIFSTLMSAVMLPLGLLKVARVVDNPFSVAKARADKAGRVLADVLINKAQGERPVTLIGYSLGSRVIYSCLQSLASQRAYGLVESAILMGSPTPSDTGDWRMMRSVVSGRLVNVFSENDAVLAFLYRTSSLQLGIAGLQPVQGLSGVENVNVSDLISGHLRYQYLIGKILTVIGLEDIDVREAAREEAALAARDHEQEQERRQNECQAGVEGQKPPKSINAETNIDKAMDDEGDRLQRQVERKTQEHLMYRKVEQWDTTRHD
ncbi:hypothetical protein MPDQ_004504 [Monascus purpureus]|uniref:Uncharacterized protein n=1 Tax=Monascus purpureus TaxID=5098 RepID=A0A507QL79_MONPU|nr:hypothetical protein MPDQ_004504 [Monascus purpureus]BDD60788.1 hypothetical protein MAP00_005889 [Monascus purpureus]